MFDPAVGSVIFTAAVNLHLYSMTTEDEQQNKNDNCHWQVSDFLYYTEVKLRFREDVPYDIVVWVTQTEAVLGGFHWCQANYVTWEMPMELLW